MSETSTQHFPLANPRPLATRWSLSHVIVIVFFWLAIYAGSLATPPLLDDADATHAQAAQAMLSSGDWVTLHVDGIRYLEKAPLPYWVCAVSLRLFGRNSFAVHVPLALEVLALSLLGYMWAMRAFDERTAFYTALFTLTSAGIFLFTRVFIPDALLSLFLCAALYCALRALTEATPRHAYAFWLLMALAVLTKGLVAVVFLVATVVLYLVVTGQRSAIARLAPLRGLLLFFLIAAPWHALAGLRNTGGANGHGFFWFYFVNEHYLRFLDRRTPRDYNKLPALIYWTQNFIWLFPWSLFTPASIWIAYRKLRATQRARELDADGAPIPRLALAAHRKRGVRPPPATFAGATVLLLLIFSAIVVVFFSFSTNQEYYTFPIYLPLLMLLAAGLAIYEQAGRVTDTLQRLITGAHIAFIIVGGAIAAALSIALWRSRSLPSTSDIGTLLAHRDIAQYTLSTSHFFDITALSLAALRMPAYVAIAAFILGPALAWMLRGRRQHVAATIVIAVTSAAFLIAAHVALVRFSPVLSSQRFAERIAQIDPRGQAEILIYGDQSFGSSIPFYLGRQVLLVDGRTTSMSFGSTFADAPPIFLTHQQLAATWGSGRPKLLFVPAEQRAAAMSQLASRSIIVMESSGKTLLADRPLDSLQ